MTCAVPSIFEAPIGRPSGLTPLEGMSDAALGALDQLGLEPSQVDVCLTSPVAPYPPFDHLNIQLAAHFAEYLGIPAALQMTVNRGGGATVAMLETARAFIESGRAETVLVVNGASSRQSARALDAHEAQAAAALNANADFSYPYGLTLTGIYALIAQRHMHDFGTTPEQVAQVVATAHEWGRLAGTNGAIDGLSVADVLASPLVADPYHELEVLRYVDGASACVVMSAKAGRQLNPVAPLILGIGSATGYLDLTQASSLSVNHALMAAGRQAFDAAGVSPADVDMFANYDAYPMTQIIALESLGFAPPGLGGRFVEDGGTAPGGRLPTSTNGGMIVQGHPVLSAALYSIAEAARQLTGSAEGRQVDNCQVAVHATYVGSGGSSAVVVLGNEVRRGN